MLARWRTALPAARRALTRGEWALLAVAGVTLAVSAAAVPVRPPREEPPPGQLSAASRPPPLRDLVVTARPTLLRAAPDPASPQVGAVGAGVALPVLGRSGPFVEVLTPCQVRGWTAASELRWLRGDPVVVLDPGHGGPDGGALGRGGLTEEEVNLDLALRAERWLRHHAPTPRLEVVLTRRGDHGAGLGYRAAVANAAGADAFLSVHLNSGPRRPSPRPGTQAIHQQGSEASRRLAGLVWEEVVGALGAYPVTWWTSRDAGAGAKLAPGGGDALAVLRDVKGPAVLVEVAVVTNPAEEALMRQEPVRQAVAEALGRALRRYLWSPDPGSGFRPPTPGRPRPGPVVPPGCRDPS